VLLTAIDPNLSLKPQDRCIFSEAQIPLSLSSIFLSFLAQFNFGLTVSSRHVVKIPRPFENIRIATWSCSMKRLLILAALAVMLGGEARAGFIISAINQTFSQNFDGLTTGTNLSVLDSSGWKLGQASPTWAGGTSALTQVQSGALTGSSSGGSYNFRDGTTTTDRSIGFLTSTSFTSPRAIMLEIDNQTGVIIDELSINFDYEKYRSGTRAFTMSFFHSSNGNTWTSASSGNHSYAADANNTTIYSNPLITSKSVLLTGLSISANTKYYLRWDYVGSGGSTNAQAIGLDNFTISAVPEPTSGLLIGLGTLACVALRRNRRVA
jgi:hypothetical protein